MEGPSMQVMTAPHDTMREGITDANAAVLPQHPVEKMQLERREKDKQARIRDLTAQHGLAAAMRFQADHKFLSQYHRLPGLPSSFAALDNYTGADMDLSFSDWLGEPESSPQYLASLHSTMEKKLGM